MRKSILFLAVALSITALLSACEKDNTDIGTDIKTDISSDADATTPNTTQNTNEQDSPQEQIAGTLEAIDGMKLTIDTSSVFMAAGAGSHYFDPNDPNNEKQKQDTIVRLTEQTDIEVRTSSGGQITSTRAGTLDDLSLKNIVMAEGEWQDDEFIAVNLIIFNY